MVDLSSAVSSVSTSEIVALAVSFLLGLLIGFLIRKVIAVGLILLAIVILLIAAGYLSPTQVEHLVQNLATNATNYVSTINSVRVYIPYNSIAFVIGFVIGLLKG